MTRAGVILPLLRVVIAGLACALAQPTPWAFAESGIRSDLVAVLGGALTMPGNGGDLEEGAFAKPRKVMVKPFRLMRHEVTNRQFAVFVSTTRHVTDVERDGAGYVWSGRWRRVKGADWRHPQGPSSSIRGLDNHPVVQVSQRDARAFCAWAGLRLPSEAEWEFAARGPGAHIFPWGNAPPGEGMRTRANFGTLECCAPSEKDGFAHTAPVGNFPHGKGPFGHLDLAGNVWEWTSTSFNRSQLVIKGGGWGNNPHCLRVRYRHGNPPDIGLDMVGFRCADG